LNSSKCVYWVNIFFLYSKKDLIFVFIFVYLPTDLSLTENFHKLNRWNEIFATHARKKGNEKCTVLSSNEWRVRRYYNTGLRRLKNWCLDKLIRSNRPANSLNLRTAPKAREVPRSIFANQSLMNSPYQIKYQHLSTFGGRSHMSIHPKPRNAYLTNFLCTGSIQSTCAPERGRHTQQIRAHKGNIKGLNSIRVLKLTWQPIHKPQYCQSP
jgi:hypothetical protein